MTFLTFASNFSFELNMNGDTVPKRAKQKKSGSFFDSSDEEDEEPEVFDDSIYEKLINRPEFKNADTIVRMDATEFNMDYVRKTGLKNPIVFTGQMDVLGINIPKFTYSEVLDRIPQGQRIDMFNHSTEKQKTMAVATIVSELQKPLNDTRSGPFNMLSLECSAMEMSKHIDAPELVRKLDWAQTVFPKAKFAHRTYSKVEKYILMTMAGSYTEFHIDFGGTSVWYHVQKGEKHFFLIEPDENNFRVFEEWLNAYRAGTKTGFFGDVVQKCAVVKMEPGQTLILPAGWIHAVYTPVDSLVYGGNFLFEYSIPMQIQVREYEARSSIRKKFTYPFYEQTLWYFAAHFVKKATNREYVRLIHSDEYEEVIAKARANPYDYCFNVELEEEDFYNKKFEDDPTQLSFDAIDERTSNDPPPKYNDEYLLSMTRDVWKNLYKVKGLLQRECDGRKQRRGKVAEGIRRPKHLLADFGRIIDYIMNDLYERSINPNVSAKQVETKVEQPVKTESIEHTEANLPAQVSTELTINTDQPVTQKSISRSPSSLTSPSKRSPNGDCSMSQASCSGESKTNGEPKSAEISPSMQDETKPSKVAVQKRKRPPKEPKPRKPSTSSTKPPPKHRKEEHLPLPSASSAPSANDPVFAAVPLGRGVVQKQHASNLKKQNRPSVFAAFSRPVSSLPQQSVVKQQAPTYNNGSSTNVSLYSPEPSMYISSVDAYYPQDAESEFYSSTAIPCVPSSSLQTPPIETYRPSVSDTYVTPPKSQPQFEERPMSVDEDDDEAETNGKTEPIQHIKPSVQAFDGLLATVDGIDEFDDD